MPCLALASPTTSGSGHHLPLECNCLRTETDPLEMLLTTQECLFLNYGLCAIPVLCAVFSFVRDSKTCLPLSHHLSVMEGNAEKQAEPPGSGFQKTTR